jgi:hypothetical protein
MKTQPSRARGASLALCALLSTISTLLSPAPAAADRHDRRASASPTRRAPPVVRLSQEERRSLVLERVLRGEGVRRCWARQLYRDPTTNARRLTVGLAVDHEGRVAQVRVRDAAAPALASCIASVGAIVAPVGPGEPFEVEGSLTFERGE